MKNIVIGLILVIISYIAYKHQKEEGNEKNSKFYFTLFLIASFGFSLSILLMLI